MVNLHEIAERLENEEQFALKYRWPAASGGETEWVTRTDPLLDVAEDSGILYVRHEGQPVWVKLEEVIEVIPNDA